MSDYEHPNVNACAVSPPIVSPPIDQAVDQAVGEIIGRLGQLSRHAGLTTRQLDNAERAGAALAETVQRFLADPAAVGTDALYQAYGRFMAAHAGNFATP